MSYKEVRISQVEESTAELLIALLSEQGYEGYEEREDALLAYIPATDFRADSLEEVLAPLGCTYEARTIEKTNWNEVWEKNFDPVVVPGFCTVRADFHEIQVDTPYEIIITPKMSFGTGHHATTKLMMQQLSEVSPLGKVVYDFGTGTGILAILASKLGASSIAAVDNEEWAVENTIENCIRNEVDNVSVLLGSVELLPTEPCDLFLANINRHVLLQYMDEIAQRTRKGGYVLMSGLLEEDESVVVRRAEDAGMKLVSKETLNGWLLLEFRC